MGQVRIALAGALIRALNYIGFKLFIISYFIVLAVNWKLDGISSIVHMNRTQSNKDSSFLSQGFLEAAEYAN